MLVKGEVGLNDEYTIQENLTSNQSEFLLYTSQNGEVKVDVLLQDETVWLTQKALCKLFGVVKSTISEHFNNIYDSSELEREATCSENPNSSARRK